MTFNRHPVDRLAEVRAEISKLEAEADKLKAAVVKLAGTLVPGEATPVDGDDNIASVAFIERETLDRKAVEAVLSKRRFEACLKKSGSLTVRVTPKMKEAA